MMEEADSGEGHDHIVLVAAFNDQVVTDGTTGLRYILNAALMGTLDIVGEGEESVGAERYTCQLVQPCALLFCGKDRGFLLEYLLPCSLGENVLVFAAYIDIYGIVAVSAVNIVTEGQIQDLGALSQPPVVCLTACQSGAVRGTAGLRLRRLPVRP